MLEQHISRPPEWYEPPAEKPVQCSGPYCAERRSPDVMLDIIGGRELFCSDTCLGEWIFENQPEVIRRLRL